MVMKMFVYGRLYPSSLFFLSKQRPCLRIRPPKTVYSDDLNLFDYKSRNGITNCKSVYVFNVQLTYYN